MQISIAAEKNKSIISSEISSFLPKDGIILEIASGTGQHMALFAQTYPHLIWKPTEFSEEKLLYLQNLKESDSLRGNCLMPSKLDVTGDPTRIEEDLRENEHWPIKAIIAINMLHASKPETKPGLFRLAAHFKKAAENEKIPLITYGPYLVDIPERDQSNREFSKWLSSQDPSWQVFHIDSLKEIAGRFGISLQHFIHMPANNYLAIWY